MHVVVLMGGISAEREVSLASGTAVAAALEEAGHRVTRIDVTSRSVNPPDTTDVVFVALHGTFGEDGGIQAILSEKGVPFTGCDEEASRLAFDKILSKRRFEEFGVNTPRYAVLRAGQERTLPLPVVVKPPRQGSSIGLTVVHDEAAWAGAIAQAFTYDDEVLIEAYIDGRELTVGIVGDHVLPVVEIRAPQGCYDYKAKYTSGLTEYLCPAPLSAETTRHCQELAWRTFGALGARGMGRVDIRLDLEENAFVLELNTIPGFTGTSLLPKAAQAAGIPFPVLCDMIVRLARPSHHHEGCAYTVPALTSQSHSGTVRAL